MAKHDKYKTDKCNKCGRPKSPEFFYVKCKKTGRLVSTCKECMRSRRKELYRENKDRVTTQNKKWREENKERHTTYSREYARSPQAKEYRSRPESKARRAIVIAEWTDKNRAKVNTANSNRRAFKKKAMPLWLTKEQLQEIKDIYEDAQYLSNTHNYDGFGYHVDHIIPLHNKSICGLHVPWNLRVIPAKENRIKNNIWSGSK